jgi:peptidoglycan hydrolase-like protein with peptidoglycan-binding domain
MEKCGGDRVALFDTTFAPYVPFGSRTLTSGATGTDVAVLQAVYNLMVDTMNPPQGPMGSPIPLTGTYDAATVEAVQNIQSYFGIAVDGIAGPDTYFLFGQGVGAHTTYGGPVYGSRQLSVASTGGDVTILQNRLNVFRYATFIGHPANGTFDEATASAVLAFKGDAAANGDTGFPSNAIAGFGFFDATWIYTFAGGRAIQSGRNGFDVVFLQALLAKLGYYGGRLTGYYDAATVAAVETFQGAAGIAVDGVVGPQTFYHLGLANPVAAPSPLGIAWPVSVPPPPPPPAPVSECSVALMPTAIAASAYGGAVFVTVASGAFSVDVVGNRLPDPSSIGPSYTQYVFTVTGSGGVVYQSPMGQIPTGPGYAGHVDGTGLIATPGGSTTVYAATASGQLGPAVLTGATCTPAPTACFNGVDNNVDLTGAASCLKASGYGFVGRYLGGPCYRGSVLTVAEATALSSAGLLLVSIYSGANTVATFSCGTQTLTQGELDGADAAAMAGRLGQPLGSAIYLDLQGGQVSPQSAWLAYVQGWTGAVAAAGYAPGVYSSPDQLTVIESQPWAGSKLLYWVALTHGQAPLVPAPCPSTVLAFASLWQYVLSTTVCGVAGMDIDSAQSSVGMWTAT